MEIPSLKKEIVSGLYAALLENVLSNNSLILATSSGIITGNPISDEEIETAKSKKEFSEMTEVESSICIDSSLLDVINKNYEEQYKVNRPTQGNDGYLWLKDATLLSGGATYHFGTLIVFYDQILGVSVGNTSANKN